MGKISQKVDKMFDFNSFIRNEENPKRICILGQTGSGKTFFGNVLSLKIMQVFKIPVIVVDPKHEQKFKQLNPVDQQFVNRRLIQKRVLHALKLGSEIIEDIRVPEFAAALCWTMENMVWYCEETVQYYGKDSTTFPSKYPLTYKINQQGRERGVWVLSSTQKLSQFNFAFVDQASDIFVFFLLPRERMVLEDQMGYTRDSLKLPDDEKFSFYHVHAGSEPVWYPAIKSTYAENQEKKGVKPKPAFDDGDEIEDGV